ncbi:hypothetical protein MPF_2093 [Methanohalophilus portucalensis FDF-1]|uniref:Uncharacterized protein n=1 Tax=Methanohalophilus portucalensis FDF-1 TaxID=523843 RepID=A0A1L9C1R0_9EURY|nr:hypothetical protein MPF_2093 [Methanohalophilus portucalensis FDF-1]
MGTGVTLPLWPLSSTYMRWMKAKARIRTGMESLCRRLRSRSATLAHWACAKRDSMTQPS